MEDGIKPKEQKLEKEVSQARWYNDKKINEIDIYFAGTVIGTFGLLYALFNYM